MRHLVVAAGTAALLLGAGDALAQGGYRAPDCELKTGHFLVNSGVVYIKGASEEADPVKRERMLGDAYRNLWDAINRGQEDNPAAWYFLGRYYTMMRDPIGADSTFDRAAELQPDCADDIIFYRQTLWVPLMNQAIDSLRAGAFDGSKSLLRSANTVLDTDNLGFYYLARIFGNEGETDSSLYYFRKVVEIGAADTARQENYQTSLFNIGLLYSMMEEWDSAAVWYAKYREIDPDDPQALTGLAQAYQKAGDAERAMVLFDSVLVRADEMEAFDLFKTGEALFLAEQFHRAAEAFELGLDKNAFFRPALYNLANAYLAICNDDDETEDAQQKAAQDMEGAARRLVDVDPLSQESQRLLAAAFQLQQKDDSTLAVLERIEAMAFEVVIDIQQAIQGGYSVQGRITNLQGEETTVPDIVFEFVDGSGNVLGTETLAGTTLGPRGSSSFALTGVGDEITAARYQTAP